MAQSDEKLIKEILKGNESAMEVLVKRYYYMVHSFVYRNVNDYNIAYDITQESFIKMMKNIDKYKLKDGNFKSWLLKIALNTTKDYFKSKIYNQRKRSDDISNYEIEDKANVIDILSKKEEAVKIKEALSRLPKIQKEALILKYYNDLKIKEISDITGENENTIKSRLFNGVKNLKKLLGGDNYEQNTNHKRKSKI